MFKLLNTLILIFLLNGDIYGFELHPAFDVDKCIQNPAKNVKVMMGLKHVLYVEKKPTLIEIHGNSKAFLDTVKKWNKRFINANDMAFKSTLGDLCIGFYDDFTGANALAVGTSHIVVGLRLYTLVHTRFKKTPFEAIRFLLAHEYAHIIQHRHGLVFNYTLPLLSSRVKELNADCMAGFMLRWNSDFRDDSWQKATAFVELLGDSHAIGDHGVAEKRRTAFLFGKQLADKSVMSGKSHMTTADVIGVCAKKYTHSNSL